ncbi:MAG: 23S rRNA (pseudouridine(1915)-N(3))-methyltransferase RlmH [Oscillospiraceae bacterium]|nr:23S rRNA (pseudouridine(1915)-N(3))-methyltransferase RlmH [Oscillospiraceae bacterium]MBQ5987973.1 23S rRNA (pseudouridine(1915)-N(3))-methyltransferase RlmH [Oscillospiraceae bacterium]MBR6835679.1 23S rRNA (pseudouridine(1915)-N(3))-methyltransferase RlmH [Oscillospiraceae bacterium]
MMSINLIAVGKLKEDYLRAASAEYAKRLQAFCTLKITEVDECRLSDRPSEAEIKNALETEAKSIMKYAKGLIIPMCIEGKQMKSEALSEKIEETALSGCSEISFVIGSSYGLADSVKNSGGLRLSMSEMTFPHQLARIMLLEQIYRAFMISAGKSYHK